MTRHSKTRDVETRNRLLDAATRLFAESGFSNVTVRDICRAAGANIAAVNYHFGDKLELYTEVVRSAMQVVREMNDLTMQTPPGTSAEDKLAHYVRTYLPRLLQPHGRGSQMHRLMHQEMTAPTPVAVWIKEQMILPRIEYLTGVVAELMGCEPTDGRVTLCVMSLQAQCLFYRPDPFRTAVFPEWLEHVMTQIDAIADHIIAFSLAGIKAIATTP